MKSCLKLMIFILLSTSCCFSSFAEEPLNLTIAKERIQQYHDTGAYLNDITHVVDKAKTYLQKRVSKNQHLSHPKKLAVVFDIDETCLSNYTNMINLDFGGTLDLIQQGLAEAKDPAILPTLQLYLLAQKLGVSTFFITARNENLKAATIKNLNSVGYHQWAGLSLKPDAYHMHSMIAYKSSERAKILDAGYDIVFNIGDQQSDLAGGSADKTFKLPNPYYLTP